MKLRDYAIIALLICCLGALRSVSHHSLTGLYLDDHPQYLRKDSTRPLDADWDAGSYTITAQGIDVTDIDFSGQLTSTVATGTAPFVVASTTVNANLNADLWDGYQFADYLDQAVKTTSNPSFTGLTVGALTYPATDADAGDIIKTDGAGTLSLVTPTVDVPICISMYNPKPARATEDNWNGGLHALNTAAAVSSGSPLALTTKGSGKILLVINAGADTAGDITATGTSVSRNDPTSQTASDTSVITLTGVTTDGSVADDGNGNTVHTFTKAYITDKWFTGVVTLSTTDVDISDLDAYHISFEQLNDSANITLNTFDINLFTSGVSPEFDAYLYTIHVTGDEADVHNESKLNIGTGTYATQATTATNSYFRLREGNLNESLNGTTDGFWVDMHYGNPANIEDVTAKVWFTETISVTLQ